MGTVVDVDKGWKGIAAELRSIAQKEVAVGLQAGDQYEDGQDIAMIAAVQEFGSPTKNIPERSFMRTTFDEKEKKWATAFSTVVASSLLGKRSIANVLDIMGLQMQNDIVNKINTGAFAPNSPVTIALKGSSKPLVDTGRMRASVRYVVRGRKGRSK